MKIRKIIPALLVATLIAASSSAAYAQRRVDKTPRRTVVLTSHRTVIYKKQPVVRRFKRLPSTAVVIHFRHHPYYYHGGRFYITRDGAYVRTVPPLGIRIAALPAGFVRVVVGSSAYFYAEGVFYVVDRPTKEYIVVKPPRGAIVYNIPSDASSVEVDGQHLTEYNGVLYATVQLEHKRGFKVVGTLDE